MPENIQNPYTDNPSSESSALGAKLTDSASQLKSKVSELGRKAADKIDTGMDAAASGLDRAAATLHEKAENLPGVDRLRDMTHATADKLSATAGCVREYDVETMVTGVRSMVRNNPGPSLAIAGVVGFLVGRAFRGHDVE